MRSAAAERRVVGVVRRGDLLAADRRDSFTVTVPASICPARLLKDWYACLPGATSATVFEPNGVVSVTVTGTSEPLTAVTAAYAEVPMQREEAETVRSTCGVDAEIVSVSVLASSTLPALSAER
ncbi:hypothetical protein ACFQ0B_49675 [Nonomuraea thailandensis]